LLRGNVFVEDPTWGKKKKSQTRTTPVRIYTDPHGPISRVFPTFARRNAPVGSLGGTGKRERRLQTTSERERPLTAIHIPKPKKKCFTTKSTIFKRSTNSSATEERRSGDVAKSRRKMEATRRRSKKVPLTVERCTAVQRTDQKQVSTCTDPTKPFRALVRHAFQRSAAARTGRGTSERRREREGTTVVRGARKGNSFHQGQAIGRTSVVTVSHSRWPGERKKGGVACG